MKRASFGLANLGVALCLLFLCGCETGVPGVTKSLFGTYTSNIDGTPDHVTSAAVQTFRNLGLTTVTSHSSKIDGSVAAKTAQGDDVKMSINQSDTNDKVSTVDVKVGSWGDKTVSLKIIKDVQDTMKHPSFDNGPGPEPSRTDPGPR